MSGTESRSRDEEQAAAIAASRRRSGLPGASPRPPLSHARPSQAISAQTVPLSAPLGASLSLVSPINFRSEQAQSIVERVCNNSIHLKWKKELRKDVIAVSELIENDPSAEVATVGENIGTITIEDTKIYASDEKLAAELGNTFAMVFRAHIENSRQANIQPEPLTLYLWGDPLKVLATSAHLWMEREFLGPDQTQLKDFVKIKYVGKQYDLSETAIKNARNIVTGIDERNEPIIEIEQPQVNPDQGIGLGL